MSQRIKELEQEYKQACSAYLCALARKLRACTALSEAMGGEILVDMANRGMLLGDVVVMTRKGYNPETELVGFASVVEETHYKPSSCILIADLKRDGTPGKRTRKAPYLATFSPQKPA